MFLLEEKIVKLAKKDYLKGMQRKDIAKKYKVKPTTIDNWKKRYWNIPKDFVQPKRKKMGAPKGNKYAGDQKRNQKAVTIGVFSKWLPKEILDLCGVIPKDATELLWMNIQLQFGAIMRSQKIMYVEDKNDMTKEASSESLEGTSYDIQYAWDKQARFLDAQSRAMKTLESMIKNYRDLVKGTMDEEQELKLKLLQAQIDNLKKEEKKDEAVDDGFLEALNNSAKEDWNNEE